MSATVPDDLLESLRDLASATTRVDCIARIEGHLQGLFGSFEPELVLEPLALYGTPDPRATHGRDADARVVLRARDRRLGYLRLANPIEADERTRCLLEAFADHAALALDNARILEHHERRARRDPLTGLLNRGEFHDMLATAVARTTRHPEELLSLAVFDLDRFKEVNDVGGHGAGDRLLRAAAAALTAVCRSSDAAFRIGGDEFAVLLPQCGTEDSGVIAARAADPDYVGAGPSVDPGSELSLSIQVGGRVWGVLNLEQMATHSFDEYDVMLAEAVVAQTGAALHRCLLVDEVERSFSTTLGVLCDALESKDAYTADHAERVAELAGMIAARLELPVTQQRDLRYCALLHDIGKIGVRSELLTKPSSLTPAEYVEVQQHSDIGFTLLARIPLLEQIAPLVRAVHERWDGGGYPDGLAGAEIPLEARIVAVCDAWHAMRYDRPYRKALSRDAALRELVDGAGSQFDPEIVTAFISTAEA